MIYSLVMYSEATLAASSKLGTIEAERFILICYEICASDFEDYENWVKIRKCLVLLLGMTARNRFTKLRFCENTECETSSSYGEWCGALCCDLNEAFACKIWQGVSQVRLARRFYLWAECEILYLFIIDYLWSI